MMTSKEEARKKIAELVRRFGEQEASYINVNYNETQTRRDFIDPFFKALGWDVDNESGYAESYREVLHEDHLKIGGKTKAPDYAFRLVGGKRLFFLEAKKPNIKLKEMISPAYQVRRYGWSAHLSISIITDFEEFAVYDCTKRPLPSDNASVARIVYMKYNQYLDKFDFIWETFSKEYVLKGSFDKFVCDTANKRGTTEVDADFLASLDDWRERLAKNIVKYTSLSVEELNYVVQLTINRLLFLRIAEDRSVEPYGQLQNEMRQGDYYQNLSNVFKIADAKYNSGLFDLKTDTISSRIAIDNNILGKIVQEMYYPKCPYEFSVLPVEILGSAYEQFLGKQVRLTASGNVKIEAKPEVCKAGGVYYTPQYIVDYIVKNTIGRWLEGKTPEQAVHLKICDPACGSGSFLIGAYQYLLDWHLEYYRHNKIKNRLTPDGRLDSNEKKRILLQNIFGVDIDANAVEVTKLSLLLKCMEGETEASINQLALFHERVLPSLQHNIKCGNSLIDCNYEDGELTFEELHHVKAFNWAISFPTVFTANKESAFDARELRDLAQRTKESAKTTLEYAIELEQRLSVARESSDAYNNGFDCIIGNPPYGASLTQQEKNYLDRKYNLGNTDTAALFMALAQQLLKRGGYNGFIIPKAFTFASNWAKVRQQILPDITDVVDCAKVWKAVKLEMSIVIQKKDSAQSQFFSYFRKNSDIQYMGSIEKSWCSQFDFILNGVTQPEIDIASRIKTNCMSLNDIVVNKQGIPNQKYTQTAPSDFKVIGGAAIKRYEGIEDIKGYISKKYITDECAYITENAVFVQRIVSHIEHPKPHIKITATVLDELDASQYVIVNTVIQLHNISKYSKYYILGLLNSEFVNWYAYKFIFANAIRTMQFYNPTTSRIPIPKNPDEQKQQALIQIVKQLLSLHKDWKTAILQNDKDQIRQYINYYQNNLDSLVYDLYGLTDEERAVIQCG